MNVCMCIHVFPSVCVCASVFVHACMCVCVVHVYVVHVCMHACVCVWSMCMWCMCVCMHVCVCGACVCAVIVLLRLKCTNIDVGILQHYPVIVPANPAEWLSPVNPTFSEELPTGTELAPEPEIPTPPQSVCYSLQKVRHLYRTIHMGICC